MIKSKSDIAVSLLALAFAAFSGVPAQAATCVGNCGTNNSGIADGDVVPAPGNFGRYDWVSTNLGQQGAAKIDSSYSNNSTTGSELVSDAFYATVGQQISFNFNYVTSDGAGYADYGFAQLINTTTGAVTNLFTARTDPALPIVPGFNMPPVNATLNPGQVYVKPGSGSAGGPVWSPLGGDSGRCYAAGCGLSGWVQSTYTVQDAGSYQLRFGAANWSDTAYQSGMAFSGLVLDGQVIGDGSSADNPLLPGEIGENGEFVFEFVATPNQTVFIDPLVAIGYDYEVVSGPNILSALFPELNDPDGYEIYLLSDLLNPIATGVMGGTVFNFGPDGVTGFALRGIDVNLGLDPENATAFVTGLTFNITSGSSTIQMSQKPVSVDVPGSAVPEPETWAMMIGGFAIVGAAMRRRRSAIAASFA